MLATTATHADAQQTPRVHTVWFHRGLRELECQDGIGLVRIAASCDSDAPDTKWSEMSLTRVDDRDHRTTYTLQCSTEAIP